MEAKWQVCGVCGFPLARVTQADKTFVGWQHSNSTQDDHIPVPVDADQIEHKQECDFCNAVPVVWEVVATSFEMLPATHVTPAQMSLGGWGACADCGDLVQRNRWTALIRRVRMRSSHDIPRGALEFLYSRLQRHIVEILPYDEWRARQDYPIPSE